ncbi:tyrosine recombinase XerC [Paenibacillus illinoisensis]|uniref:tyrosine recombinase XerC n=1 Tax=Paenibacillus illinoisensis TaxID=59845 RepID=UPI0030172AD2
MKARIEEYLNFLKAEKNCSKNTLRGYRVDIEQFADKQGITSIEQISKQAIRAHIALLVENGTAASTRNRKLTSIRSFCNYLFGEGYIASNPAIAIQYAKIDKKLPKVMSVTQTLEFIDSADNLRDKAAMETLYGTGARVEELVNIKLTDIDFEQSLVRLFGKGGKERIVPISGAAIAVIKEYLETRGNDSEYLFESPVVKGKPISTRAMYNITIKYAQQSPHKFRHSVATHLLGNGMDIREIQELLGHENINTTTVYTQVAVEQMAKGFHRAHPRG